jgi:hypothetical protein
MGFTRWRLEDCTFFGFMSLYKKVENISVLNDPCAGSFEFVPCRVAFSVSRDEGQAQGSALGSNIIPFQDAHSIS